MRDKHRGPGLFETILHDIKPAYFKGVGVKRKYNYGQNTVTTKRSILYFKWYCPDLVKRHKFVKFCGLWKTNDKLGGDKIDLDYHLIRVKSDSNTIKNTPSVLTIQKYPQSK